MASAGDGVIRAPVWPFFVMIPTSLLVIIPGIVEGRRSLDAPTLLWVIGLTLGDGLALLWATQKVQLLGDEVLVVNTFRNYHVPYQLITEVNDDNGLALVTAERVIQCMPANVSLFRQDKWVDRASQAIQQRRAAAPTGPDMGIRVEWHLPPRWVSLSTAAAILVDLVLILWP